MPRWINMDGSLHVAGDTTYCSCEKRHSGTFEICRRCGGPQHWQPVYGGIDEACSRCDAERWTDGPLPLLDELGFPL